MYVALLASPKPIERPADDNPDTSVILWRRALRCKECFRERSPDAVLLENPIANSFSFRSLGIPLGDDRGKTSL
jgi:hypothetical protein